MTDLAPETIVVHAGRPARSPGGPLSAPVTFSAPFHAGVEPDYACAAEPTAAAFEVAAGALEGGEAVAFSSGMAAIDAALETLVPVGGTVVAPVDAYNGTKDRLAFGEGRGRWSVRWVDASDTGAVAGAAAGADLLWLESPSNPELRVADVPALCRLGVPAAVDNTFATPLNQRPLTWGATAIVHSATKLLSGHSDLLAGLVVAADPERTALVRAHRTRTGAVLGPMEAFLALRGLRTLAVRLARAEGTAALLAARLADHPAVALVRYPGLVSDPGHATAGRTMAGFGTVLSFEPAGGAEAAARIAGAVRLIVHATSLGGVETTLDRRGDVPAESHVSPALLRLSVGLEDPEDLWRDLAAALAP